jgi:NADH dehydrogenase/NADH:ubiquinone oxidoreductase subunit G
MSDLVLTIDGSQIKASEGMTILQASEENGIRIPTLCHSPDLKPSGVCRVCLVEVEGSKTLVAACYTPVSRGMVVQTRSPKVLETRKTIISFC